MPRWFPSARTISYSSLTSADIDDVADIILSKASNRFLDAALDARLRTIEGKPLINALARAERLGYEAGDLVEEDQVRGQERVIPQPLEAYPGARAAADAVSQLRPCRLLARRNPRDRRGPPYSQRDAPPCSIQRGAAGVESDPNDRISFEIAVPDLLPRLPSPVGL